MSKVIKIYCEGTSGSHDFDLITKAIDTLTVQIIPIGGKRGAKSAIQVKEEGLSKSDFKLFFRDRDFDAPVPDSEKLQNDGSYVYFSYRTTIENYLLDYSLIEEYSRGKSWYSNNLKGLYFQAAKNIKYFQATRHTLGKLRTPTDFGSNIVSNSGVLPDDLSEEYCREKGYEKIMKSLEKTKSWNRETYDKSYNSFVSLFDDEFINDGQFLIYYQGKDFMRSLCSTLPGFSPKQYYRFAKSKFNYLDFKDFVELRRIIENELK